LRQTVHEIRVTSLGWAQAKGEVEVGLRLAAALGAFWFMHGYLYEGRQWCEAMLRLMEARDGTAPLAVRRVEGRPRADSFEAQGAGAQDARVAGAETVTGEKATAVTRARIRVLGAMVASAWNQNDIESVQAWGQQELAVARAFDDVWGTYGVVHATACLGGVALARGDTARGTALYEEAIALARQGPHPLIRLYAIYFDFGYLLLQAPGQEARAAVLLEECLMLARAAGDVAYEGLAHYALGLIAFRAGDRVRMQTQAKQCLHVTQTSGILYQVPACLDLVAMVTGQQGEGERAARLLGAGTALSAHMGVFPGDWELAMYEAAVAPARAALGEEQWAAAYAVGQAMTLEEAMAEALGEETGEG
jgi:tetratricopeptide (TPR) repeat protein